MELDLVSRATAHEEQVVRFTIEKRPDPILAPYPVTGLVIPVSSYRSRHTGLVIYGPARAIKVDRAIPQGDEPVDD
jgi:hypothetical protein